MIAQRGDPTAHKVGQGEVGGDKFVECPAASRPGRADRRQTRLGVDRDGAVEQIAEDCERNKWLGADEMASYGLVDKVIAHLPVAALVDQLYAEVESLGGGRWDTSSLLARLEALRGRLGRRRTAGLPATLPT